MLPRYKLEDLMEQFNSSQDSIRIVTIVSPTCLECLQGFEVVRKLFKRFDTKKMRGFIIWIPMLEKDNEQAAQARSATVEDQRISQFWDQDRSAGRLFGSTLRLQNGVAWDVYLLYSPRIKWENEEEAPEPSFWMHQLDSGEPSLKLDSERFGDETKFLLDAEDPDLSDLGVEEVLLDKKKKTRQENPR
jgi:hypothetical protein